MTKDKSAVMGEIITWNTRGEEVGLSVLIKALEDADLDPSLAREIAPRAAFSRACKHLNDKRIIRKIKEDKEEIEFQFTKESKVADLFEYGLEAKLVLHKKTGSVSSDSPELARKAQELVDHNVGVRCSIDIASILKSVFNKEGDIFKVPDATNVYIVLEMHMPLLQKVEAFTKSIGRKITRVVHLPKGTDADAKSCVKNAVKERIQEMVKDHRDAISKFDPDTRSSTLEKMVDRIKLTESKIEIYAQYLDDAKDEMYAELAAEREKLREKLIGVAEKDLVPA